MFGMLLSYTTDRYMDNFSYNSGNEERKDKMMDVRGLRREKDGDDGDGDVVMSGGE
jgi:hypothetical protein